MTETTGTVSAWKATRGFGFAGDTYLHVRECDGITPLVGSIVSFELTTDKDGRKVGKNVKVLQEPENAKKIKGKVKCWITDKKIGFITGNDNIDYFVHENQCWGKPLEKDQEVIFNPSKDDDNRTIALNIMCKVTPKNTNTNTNTKKEVVQSNENKKGYNEKIAKLEKILLGLANENKKMHEIQKKQREKFIQKMKEQKEIMEKRQKEQNERRAQLQKQRAEQREAALERRREREEERREAREEAARIRRKDPAWDSYNCALKCPRGHDLHPSNRFGMHYMVRVYMRISRASYKSGYTSGRGCDKCHAEAGIISDNEWYDAFGWYPDDNDHSRRYCHNKEDWENFYCCRTCEFDICDNCYDQWGQHYL